MHMKKQGLKSYGGLEKKYEDELSNVMFGSMALAVSAGKVMNEMHRDDGDHGDIQSGWLNGPYQLLLNLERNVVDLEKKVMADSEFSDRFKRMFIAELLEPAKDGNRKAREIDAYVMNGTIPQGKM